MGREVELSLLATVGTSRYEETQYFLEDKLFSTRFSFHALDRFYSFKKVYLIVTQDAYTKWGEEAKKIFGERLVPLHIPDGLDEPSMWEIFEKVVERIPAEIRLVVDITHGFRSLPFILSLICNFLKVQKGVEIEEIYYGAFEARRDNKTPFVKLGRMFSLIDWSYGIQVFKDRGSPRDIGGLLPRREGGKWIKGLRGKLKELDEFLDLGHPYRIGETSKEVLEVFEKSHLDLEQKARPVAKMSQELKRELERLVWLPGDVLKKEDLEKLEGLVHWYEEKGQLAKAVSLARELMINRLLFGAEFRELKKHWNDHEGVRKEAENRLNKFVSFLASPKKKEIELDEKIQNIGEVWNGIRDKRNQINHHGFQKNVDKYRWKSLKKQLGKFYQVYQYDDSVWKSFWRFVERCL